MYTFFDPQIPGHFSPYHFFYTADLKQSGSSTVYIYDCIGYTCSSRSLFSCTGLCLLECYNLSILMMSLSSSEEVPLTRGGDLRDLHTRFMLSLVNVRIGLAVKVWKFLNG